MPQHAAGNALQLRHPDREACRRIDPVERPPASSSRSATMSSRSAGRNTPEHRTLDRGDEVGNGADGVTDVRADEVGAEAGGRSRRGRLGRGRLTGTGLVDILRPASRSTDCSQAHDKRPVAVEALHDRQNYGDAAESNPGRGLPTTGETALVLLRSLAESAGQVQGGDARARIEREDLYTKGADRAPNQEPAAGDSPSTPPHNRRN